MMIFRIKKKRSKVRKKRDDFNNAQQNKNK